MNAEMVLALLLSIPLGIGFAWGLISAVEAYETRKAKRAAYAEMERRFR